MSQLIKFTARITEARSQKAKVFRANHGITNNEIVSEAIDNIDRLKPRRKRK